jgi:hydrogenase maturation protein HypF
VLTGRVQGVGFRPFVYRLATTHALSGWVRNNVGLVEIFIEGESTAIQAFTRNLFRQAPSLAEPELESCETTESAGLATFTIRDSVATGTSRIHVPPDLFTCDDCLAELHDSGDRRYRYGGLRTLRSLPEGIPGSGQPALSCRAGGMSGMRAEP